MADSGHLNIAGETVEEFVELATLLEGVEGIAGIEVNVSCPNVLAGGAVFGADASAVEIVTASVRRVTTLPMIVKLSPIVGMYAQPHWLLLHLARMQSLSSIPSQVCVLT